MKKILTILILLIGFSAFSQREGFLKQLNQLMERNDNPNEIFWNDADKILDLNGFQIPVYSVRYMYLEEDGNWLGFACDVAYDPQCIYDPKENDYMKIFAIPMKSKADVYEAIDLINHVKHGY